MDQLLERHVGQHDVGQDRALSEAHGQEDRVGAEAERTRVVEDDRQDQLSHDDAVKADCVDGGEIRLADRGSEQDAVAVGVARNQSEAELLRGGQGHAATITGIRDREAAELPYRAEAGKGRAQGWIIGARPAHVGQANDLG